MSDDPEHLARMILKVREARFKLAAQIERAIRDYRETTELESTLLERSEILREELARTEALLPRSSLRRIH